MEKSPGKVRGYVNLGQEWQLRGFPDKAEMVYQRGLRLCTEMKDDTRSTDHIAFCDMIRSNLAGILFERGQTSDALTLLGQALKGSPTYRAAKVNAAAVYIMVGRAPEGLEILKGMPPSVDEDPEREFYLGEAYRLLGDCVEARVHYKVYKHWYPEGKVGCE